MNQLWSLQTPRTFTDKHTHRLPCQCDREGQWAELLPTGSARGAGGFASLRDYYCYYWVYFYIELPTKCKDLLSGIGFYLILAYFCTVYRLTVTFEQLSKYSNIYRAGRAGCEERRAMGTGQAPAGPSTLRCELRARCRGAGVEVHIWGGSCESTSMEVQVQRYRCACTGGSSPAEETRATAGLTGSATLLSASAAFWKSSSFSCRAGVRSSTGEMRNMKWGDKANPQAG